MRELSRFFVALEIKSDDSFNGMQLTYPPGSIKDIPQAIAALEALIHELKLM